MASQIKILSWNVCWGCMTENTGDMTASGLAGHCIKRGNMTCLKNASAYISEENINKNIDFVCLQEASKYQNIRQETMCLQNMGLVSYRDGLADIATFYNSRRFKINYLKVGNLKESGRPYIIHFMYDMQTNKHIVLVNLHAPHADLKPIFKNVFNLSSCYDVSKITSQDFINIQVAQQTTDITSYLQSHSITYIFYGKTYILFYFYNFV